MDYYKCSNFVNETEIEVGLDSTVIMQKLRDRIVIDGGIFLCIDYGQDKPIVDTFRVRFCVSRIILSNKFFLNSALKYYFKGCILLYKNKYYSNIGI